jgi:hypothetical protein
MSRFPLRYARRNILIGPDGEASALYRAEGVAYPFLPTSQKWALLHRLERFAHLAGTDFALWRVARSFPAERYAEDLAGLLDPEHGDPEAWQRYLSGHEDRLRELGSQVPEVYVAISLSESEDGPGALRSFDRVRRRVEELAGIGGPRPISGAELEALAAIEQRTFDRLSGAVALQRASTRELQWLLRRAACLGVAEPALDRNWEPDALVLVAPDGSAAYEPLECDLWHCANAPATEDPGRPPSLVVEAEEGTSYQSFLCAGSLAEEAEFPGAAELLFDPLDGAGFPVDAVLHAQWIGNREALGQVRKRILDVEHAYREQLEGASGPGVLAEEDRELAREYEAILQSSAHPPMLRASLSLAVGAPDRKQLERRVTSLRERFGEVALHRPRGLQHALFADHLPQPGGGQVGDYRQQMTVEQFGAMVATAGSALGSPDGIYLGHTPQGRPVRFDPTEAPRTARPSGVLLAGTLGSGKTIAAQAIAFAAQRRGSLVVDFDPKPDHGLDRVAELEGQVEVLELSGAPEHRGKLDPLAIGLPELREELAASYLNELLRDPPPAWENAIDRGVRDAVRAGERCLGLVVDRLRACDADAGREAAEALDVLSDFGLARLGFATPREDSEPVASEASVITIRTPGLSLPDPGVSRETYTRAERVSVATLSLVAAQALRLVSSNRHRHKIVLLDEAWFFLSSAQGRALLNRLIRLARAFNATVLVATQRLADLGDLSELFGVYLLFGQETEAEARAGLVQIGLAAETPLVQRLTEYRRGHCLARDLDGRVGEMQVDPVFPELLAALDNTPQAVGA